jgi:tetratricopeptide (TPR) repeat protein
MSERTYRNALQSGYLLHWYRIDSVLGQGGFGITYLAHDANLDHPVAIKEFLPVEMAMRDADLSVQPSSQDMDERFRWGLDRFVAEARTLARFRHSGIVRVLSVFEANNTAYMVMELERGETLHQRLARQRTLPEAELLAIIEPLLDGLEAVHAAGFVHRDIKPANIIIRPDESPVLIDFGSARQAIGQYTRTLTTLISPGYAPYEQYLSGGDRQGPWTDIYSLAATLYRCAVGKPPLDALERSEALLKSERDLYMPASGLAGGEYSPALLRAIDHGLCFKAADRPQSVAEWRKELRGELEEPVTRVATAMPEIEAKQATHGRTATSPRAATTMRLAEPELPAGAGGASPASAAAASRRRYKVTLTVLAVVALAALLAWQWQQRLPRDEAVVSTRTASAVDQPAPHDQVVAPEVSTAAPAEIADPGPDTATQELADATAPPDSPTAPDGDATEVRSRLEAAHAAAEAAPGRPEQYATVVAKYRAVLELDPENSEASAGLTSIAVLLAKQSLDALRANDLAAAEAALAQAESTDAQAPLVATARQQLDAVNSVAEAAHGREADAEGASIDTGRAAERQPGEPEVPEAGNELLALLDRADADLKADRLGAPRGENALERYQAVLDRDPGNERAREGIDAVAARYGELARGSLRRGDLDRAERYIERGRALRPALPIWPTLQTDLGSTRRQRTTLADVDVPAIRESTPSAPAPGTAAAPAIAATPPPVAVVAPPSEEPTPPIAPTVAVQVVGLEKDFKRFGLSEEDIRAAVSQRLQKAGYQSSATGGLTLALILKYSYNSTTGIYSYSTTVTARGSGNGGAPVNWSGGETGIAQDRDIRKLNGIFLKHVDAFVAAHPAR